MFYIFNVTDRADDVIKILKSDLNLSLSFIKIILKPQNTGVLKRDKDRNHKQLNYYYGKPQIILTLFLLFVSIGIISDICVSYSYP